MLIGHAEKRRMRMNLSVSSPGPCEIGKQPFFFFLFRVLPLISSVSAGLGEGRRDTVPCRSVGILYAGPSCSHDPFSALGFRILSAIVDISLMSRMNPLIVDLARSATRVAIHQLVTTDIYSLVGAASERLEQNTRRRAMLTDRQKRYPSLWTLGRFRYGGVGC